MLRFSLLLCAAAFAFVGCDATSPEPAVGDLYVDVFTASSSDPSNRIYVRTKELLGCSNYELDVRSVQTAEEIEIEIDGVTAPEVCQRAVDAASQWVVVDDVDPVGLRVEFKKGGQTDEYVIVRNGPLLGLEPVRTSFTSIPMVFPGG